mmetsp:Transcript_23801/g.61099  ORF Transcript_23801/g.61099 Transcript_23801/m.61099 type:complete len:208 (-) Transcript_23801:265-888(-)
MYQVDPFRFHLLIFGVADSWDAVVRRRPAQEAPGGGGATAAPSPCTSASAAWDRNLSICSDCCRSAWIAARRSAICSCSLNSSAARAWCGRSWFSRCCMFQSSRPRLIICVSYCMRLAAHSPGDSVSVCRSSVNVNTTSLFSRSSSPRTSMPPSAASVYSFLMWGGRPATPSSVVCSSPYCSYSPSSGGGGGGGSSVSGPPPSPYSL